MRDVIADRRKTLRRRRQDLLIGMDAHAGPLERNAVEQGPTVVKSGNHRPRLLRLSGNHNLVKALVRARAGDDPKLFASRFNGGDRTVGPQVDINQHPRHDILYALGGAHDSDLVDAAGQIFQHDIGRIGAHRPIVAGTGHRQHRQEDGLDKGLTGFRLLQIFSEGHIGQTVLTDIPLRPGKKPAALQTQGPCARAEPAAALQIGNL